MSNLKYYNCPQCDKPTFIRAEAEQDDTQQCEHCGAEFSVEQDARPFEMCSRISPNDAVYAC
jgi:ribosomal protein L37AE/L43A